MAKAKKAELPKAESSQSEAVLAKEYGIEPVQVKELSGNLPQLRKEREVLEARYNEILTMDIEDPKTAKAAKEIRLKIRDNRTKGIEVWHRTNKDYFLRGGQFIDAVKRKEIAINQLMEENLEKIEKHQELKEKARIDALRVEREAETESLRDYIPTGLDLGKLSDKEYKMIKDGAELQHKEAIKVAEEKRKEEEEIARRVKVGQQNKAALIPFATWIDGFNELDFESLTPEMVAELTGIAHEKARAEAAEKVKKEAEEQAAKEAKAQQQVKGGEDLAKQAEITTPMERPTGSYSKAYESGFNDCREKVLVILSDKSYGTRSQIIEAIKNLSI